MSANFPYSTESSSRFSCKLEQEENEIRVHIKNLAYRSETFTVWGRSRGINYSPKEKQRVILEAGESTTIRFSIQASRISLIGNKDGDPFRVLVQASKGETQVLKGKIRNPTILSPVQALIIFVLILSVFFISRKAKSAGGFSIFPTDTPTPTLTPLPTQSPTPQPHAGEILYLTFDDGPSIWTQDILAILAKHNVKATFFIVGQKVEEFPDIIRAEASAGHVVAHHTWSHISVNGIGFDAFAEQIYLTNAVLPVAAAPCIRLPFADEGYFTEDYAAEMGLEMIWWDVDPFDWNSPGQEYIEEFVISEASHEKIILLHDGGGNRAQTVAALDRILAELTAQGYRFETLCR